ncbi:hypothetical protein B5M43_005170 [Microbacterium sp. MEC084]|uniref:hypothetical protein n=1 Tax=unclassified Microbacterium TaxID=2609290 RepID=UPI0006FBA76E|nr:MULTISPECIES: hypothetical protein [unclassified Microbacterium]KQY97042.1 hypothetical protein ASD19_08925 [Microbacterium sp. Root53]MCD1268243.1 hypothetical protein [Microbacterium sp. MEC084]
MARTPSQLPPELRAGSFSVAEARRLGVSPRRLGASDLAQPYRGLRTSASADAPTALLERCLEYAPRMSPDQFYSGETALALHGVPTPRFDGRIPIHVATHRPHYPPRIAGIERHRLQRREAAWSESAPGLRVESPVRAWRQAAQTWTHDDLVIAADHMILPANGLATLDELRDEVRLMGDLRGGVLASAIRHARVGAESPGETRLRLVLVRGGLPEPDLNHDIYDDHGTHIARLDQAYVRYRVAPEYDGRVHAEDVGQFRRDADRWEAIRAAGWRHVRILAHHVRGAAPRAVSLVREALLERGWRPGDSS